MPADGTKISSRNVDEDLQLKSEISREPRARKQLHFWNADAADDGGDKRTDASSVMDEWLDVGRDLRNLADRLAGHSVPGHSGATTHGHSGSWSPDISSTGNLLYSVLMFFLLRKLMKIIGVDMSKLI